MEKLMFRAKVQLFYLSAFIQSFVGATPKKEE